MCLGPESSVMMYADDAKIFSIFKKNDSLRSFQISLDNFRKWCDDWQLHLAISKCKVLHLGTGNPCCGYQLGDVQLSTATSVRDLGFIIDRSLKFNEHISGITKKASSRVALLFRAFRTRNSHILLRCYKTYIRPLLEYGSCVWSPHLIKHKVQLEKIQRLFTRKLYRRCGLEKSNYAVRLLSLDLESLETRRNKADLIMCYKILNSLVDASSDSFFTVNKSRSRQCGDLNLERTHTKLRKFYFSNRAISVWNKLPNVARKAGTLASFKRHIDNFQ